MKCPECNSSNVNDMGNGHMFCPDCYISYPIPDDTRILDRLTQYCLRDERTDNIIERLSQFKRE